MRQKHWLLLLIFFLGVCLLFVSRNPGHFSKLDSEMERALLETRELSEMGVFLASQKRRVLRVREACAQGVSKVSYKLALYNLIADKEQSILFCPIFKSASTSWLIALLEMRGEWTPQNTPDDLNAIRKRVYKILMGFTPSDQDIFYQNRFLVVRHPFERLVSCYRDKFENANKPYYHELHGKRMMRMYRDLGDNPVSRTEVNNLMARADADPDRERVLGNPFANPVGPTFTEFIKYVVSKHSDDEHWTPYHHQCAPCSIDYNFILKFENLNKENAQFLQRLNAGADVGQRKDNIFSGPPTAEVACSYFSQLDTALLYQLTKKYEPDFKLFGYTPNEYLKCSDEYIQP
ncbi:carbohydrate sulfotransferase 12-like [Hyalella azteca]|uniref:Carbohydrate sulfotransferase n=1 Tax=Hyalella azteca TaxID=294128 RepID=A0A8B7NKX7_HYAAZ|nr:carbohydrate sulfotransferase 12-like [Hyalella azteca]